jgi:hypothetical protein
VAGILKTKTMNQTITKPSWKSAPEWANWLAQDADGEWCWFKHKPVQDPEMQIWNNDVSLAVKGEMQWQKSGESAPNENWRKTLEKRPK